MLNMHPFFVEDLKIHAPTSRSLKKNLHHRTYALTEHQNVCGFPKPLAMICVVLKLYASYIGHASKEGAVYWTSFQRVILRHVQYTAHLTTYQHLCIVKSNSYISQLGFGKPHTSFGVLLSVCA